MPKKRPTRRRLAPLPTSNAANALELVKDVRRVILAEPRRVDMGTICDVRTRKQGGPDCNTVGCFAGWISILAGNSVRQIRKGFDTDFAKSLLGEMNYMVEDHNGHGDECHVFDAGEDLAEAGLEQGTVAYARAVAKRIDRFIEANKMSLADRKLAKLPDGRIVPVERRFVDEVGEFLPSWGQFK